MNTPSRPAERFYFFKYLYFNSIIYNLLQSVFEIGTDCDFVRYTLKIEVLHVKLSDFQIVLHVKLIVF